MQGGQVLIRISRYTGKKGLLINSKTQLYTYLYYNAETKISGSLIDSMIRGMKKIIKEEDSVIIYKFMVKSYIENIVIGREKGDSGNIK